MLLELENVSKSFGEGNSRTEVLKDINLKIAEGEFVAIVGFTGSGKTTLIKLIAGLLKPERGEILFKGQPVIRPGKERGVVFQNYSLLPWCTVFQNVMLAVDAVYPRWTSVQRANHAKQYIEMVNLSAAMNKRPRELSGGMRQRVSLARTLVMNPDLLLMDEPLSALDAITRGSLQTEIVNLREKNRTTALLITNDVDEGILMADRIIPLHHGPKATLGPEFNIAIDRPRNKTSLNDNGEFIKIRNQIIEYLLDMTDDFTTKNNNSYQLPAIEPVMPGALFRRPVTKAA